MTRRRAEEDAERNERLAEANLARGAPLAEGETGGNALSGGQTEPALPAEVTDPPVPSARSPTARSPHTQDAGEPEA